MEETKKSKYIPRIQEFPLLYRVNLFIKDSMKKNLGLTPGELN